MSIFDNLNTFVGDAQNILSILQGLIDSDASTTPIPDDSVSYSIPTPTYDEALNEWTFTQDTADTDGLYKGLYKLAIDTGCSFLTLISHDIVTPADGIPARYLLCDAPSLTDVATLSDIDGKEISKLEFRSQQPFSVKISLATTWCRSLKPGDSNVILTMGQAGMYYDADGWHGNNATQNDFARLYVTIADPNIVSLTRIEIEFTTNGNRQYLSSNGPEFQLTGTYSTNQEYAAGRQIHTVNTNTCGNFTIFCGDYATIHEVRLYGTGVNAFGTDNCS